MENDLRGRALATLVVRREQQPVGALTIVKAGEGRAAIDLVAVDPSAQGQGLGAALVGAFITWVRARNLVGRVGTQADNRALALYQRCGFVPVERAQTYHVWIA
jgi:GNAT superfamily N-acetyltransferase